MTLASPLPARAARPADWRARFEAASRAPAFVVFIAVLVFVWLQASGLQEVWSGGGFDDADDAMRLTQVRDFMAGKGWSDLLETRMNAPFGFRIHWSRVVDLPLAGLIWLFSYIFDVARAEIAARLAFPVALFALTIAALVAAARRLIGPGAVLAVGLMAPFCVFTAQYRAGRIDHHAPQILLLSVCALATLVSLDPRRARVAAAAALAAALSLAISIENLPYLAAFAAVYAVAGAAAPSQARAAAIFGGAFALFAALAWLAFADHVVGPVCDALSTFHLTLAVAGGLGLVALGVAAPRLGAVGRWAGLATLAAALAATARLRFPQCLADPLATVPAIMVDLWLSDVPEAAPLFAKLALRPDVFAAVAAPSALAVAVAAWAARRETGVTRLRWFALGAVLLVGLATTIWQVRSSTSMSALAVLAAAYAPVSVARALTRRQFSFAPSFAFAAALPFTPLPWIAATSHAADGDAEGAAKRAQIACLAPGALASLDRAAPPARLLASIDPGAHLLAFTRHEVLAGAYHRNVAGNVDALTAWTADLAVARDVLTRRGVTMAAVCDGLFDLPIYARRAPNGLAARLAQDNPPDWMERVPVDGPWRLYRLRAP